MALPFEGEEGAAKAILAANVFLVGSKLSVALLTGSIGVIAVLVDSVFDFAGGLLAYLGIRKSREPPDEDHHYGHRKFGSLSSLAQLGLIFITALLILLEASRRMLNPVQLQITGIDLALMSITIAIDVFMASYLMRKAREHSSSALETSAGNYTSDIFQNGMVLAGLFAASWGFQLADPLSAVVVSLLMMRIVFKFGRKSVLELTDAGPSRQTLARIGHIIMAHKEVKSFHKLRARSLSGSVYVDVHVQLNPKLSLKKAHGIAEEIKRELIATVPGVREVLIHEEPYERSDD